MSKYKTPQVAAYDVRALLRDVVREVETAEKAGLKIKLEGAIEEKSSWANLGSPSSARLQLGAPHLGGAPAHAGGEYRGAKSYICTGMDLSCI